jgi:hypothetical protein
MGYAVKHSNGRKTEFFGTYEEAEAAVRRVYTDPAIGHSGDIADGGERTLVWADEASSVNDAGARAVASIERLHEVP